MVKFSFQVLPLCKYRKGIEREKERWKIKVTVTAGAMTKLLLSSTSFKVPFRNHNYNYSQSLAFSSANSGVWNFRQSHCGPVEASSSPQEPEEEHDDDDDVEKEEEPLLGWIPVLLNEREAREVVKGRRQMKKERPSPPVKYHQKYIPIEAKRCVWGGMEQEPKLKNFTHFQSPKYLHRQLGRKNNNKKKKK